MLCALCGEVPEEPVVSRKTGIVYESRLIHKYIEEHQGKGPGDEDELEPEDLLPIKTGRIVRPRPPNFTSLPSLLRAFQDEWDAVALESYTAREQLARTREELAMALYQQEAAIRVIARLTKERDEARVSLSQVTVMAKDAPTGDAMQIDDQSLPEHLVAVVEETKEELTKSRKKRPIPEGWSSAEDLATFSQAATTSTDVPKPSTLAVAENLALVGGLEGDAVVCSLAQNAVQTRMEPNQPVTNVVWAGDKAVFSTLKGSVLVYQSDNGDFLASFAQHAGPVTGLAVHPSGKLLASVGSDKSFVFYSLYSLRRVMRAYADSPLTTCNFHPDGHLFAAGTQTGVIYVYDTKSGALMADFVLGAPLQAIVFSENGYYLAAAGKGLQAVTIFDIRKKGDATRIKELQTGDVRALAWDFTGQFLATIGSQGITVQHFEKGRKKWSEALRNSTAGVGIQWGAQAKALIVLSEEGSLAVLSKSGD